MGFSVARTSGMSNQLLKDFIAIVDFLDRIDLSKYSKEKQKKLLKGANSYDIQI